MIYSFFVPFVVLSFIRVIRVSPKGDPCLKTTFQFRSTLLTYLLMKHKELTGRIIECAFRVHKNLGFGFLESVYQNALLIELIKAGLKAEKEKKIQVDYDGEIIGDFVADILVEEKVILELKSVKDIHPAHEAQLINYLKATEIEVGLLINFGEKVEIKRKVLDQT